MIPKLQAGTLRLIGVTAREFAEEGQLADGYTCLMRGLKQAISAVACGEPWGAALVLGYREAEEKYIACYGVRIEAGSEAETG